MKFNKNFLIFKTILFFFFSCDPNEDCYKRCTQAYNKCFAAVSLQVSNNFQDAGKIPVRPTQFGNEVEPNDTFLNSFASTENGLTADIKNSFILKGNISSQSDIDIFDIGATRSGYRNLTVLTGNGNISCNLYKKNTLIRLTTNSNSLDGTWTFEGVLTSRFGYEQIAGVSLLYLICSSQSPIAYSIKLDFDESAQLSGSIPRNDTERFSQEKVALSYSFCPNKSNCRKKDCRYIQYYVRSPFSNN